MKPLPHIVTDDEFFFATEAQRKEWNARIAAGCEPADLSLTGPLNLPSFEPLAVLCTWAEYDAATDEQKSDWDTRLLQLWNDGLAQQLVDDIEADHRRGSWGE